MNYKLSLRYIFFIFGLLLFMPEMQAQSNVIDEVIWVVGDEPILKSDVEQMRIEAQSMGQRIDGDPYCVIPEQLAVQKLFLHQAAIDSVEVTDAQVLQSVEKRLNFYIQQLGSKEKMEEYFGKTSLQIREQLFELVKNEMIIDEVRDNLMENVKVTPAQVRRFLAELPEDSIPFVPTQLEVQILVRKPQIAKEEIDRIKNLLRDITEQVNTGKAQFSTMALRYSEDRESASRGGELGFSLRSDFVPEFSAVAFNLTDPKTVSKIVETEFGFHIIQMIEKRGDRVNFRHILMRPRVSDEALTNTLAQMDSIMDGVDKKEYTFEEAVAHVSEDKDTRANYGIMVNRNRESDLYGTPSFEMKDLPSEVAREVANLKDGAYSKPFIMVDESGKEVVAVVKLKSRVNGHRATMQDDYQTLQNALVAKLKEEKVGKWIREMQKKTYVRINEEWRDCEFKYPGWIK